MKHSPDYFLFFYSYMHSGKQNEKLVFDCAKEYRFKGDLLVTNSYKH